MRECVALAILYLSIKMIGAETALLITVGLLASLAAVLYIALSLLQRYLIGGRWFTSTPGQAQTPPFDDEYDDETPPPS